MQRASLSVLGFTQQRFVPLELRAGDQVVVITAREGDEHGAVALSAFIQGMMELNMVGITRRVYRKGLNPVLGALYPDITPEYECLMWIALPFQEDLRNFTFPSLKNVTESLTDEQRDAMDQCIDSMYFNDETEMDDPFVPNSMLNPQLQHHFNCLTERAINPNQPPPAPTQHILDILSARSLCEMNDGESLAKKLKTKFPIEKMMFKKKKDALALASDDAEPVASTSGAQNSAATSSDLRNTSVKNVSTVSPAQDFRAMLRGDQPNYPQICREMEQVLLQLCENLSGSDVSDQILLTKIVESLKCFREDAKMIDPSPYNRLLPQLKTLVLARSFNHLWLLLKTENLGLITHSENLHSSHSESEAETFLTLDGPTAASPSVEEQQDNYDDMLDDL